MIIVRTLLILIQGVFLLALGYFYDLENVGRYFILQSIINLSTVPIACGLDRYIQRRYFLKNDTLNLIRNSLLSIFVLSYISSILIFFVLSKFYFINLVKINYLYILISIWIFFNSLNYYVLLIDNPKQYQNWIDNQLIERLVYFFIILLLITIYQPSEIIYLIFIEWSIGVIFIITRIFKFWKGLPNLKFEIPNEYLKYLFVSIINKFMQQLLSRGLILLPANMNNLEIPAIFGYAQKIFAAIQTIIIYINNRNFNLLSIASDSRKDLKINNKILNASTFFLIISSIFLLYIFNHTQYLILILILLISFYLEVLRNLDNNTIIFKQMNVERLLIFIPSVFFLIFTGFIINILKFDLGINIFALILLLINLLNFISSKYLLNNKYVSENK